MYYLYTNSSCARLICAIQCCENIISISRGTYMTFQIDHMKFQIDQVTQKGVLTALPIIGADFLQAMLNPQSEFSCGITG